MSSLVIHGLQAKKRHSDAGRVNPQTSTFTPFPLKTMSKNKCLAFLSLSTDFIQSLDSRCCVTALGLLFTSIFFSPALIKLQEELDGVVGVFDLLMKSP